MKKLHITIDDQGDTVDVKIPLALANTVQKLYGRKGLPLDLKTLAEAAEPGENIVEIQEKDGTHICIFAE